MSLPACPVTLLKGLCVALWVALVLLPLSALLLAAASSSAGSDVTGSVMASLLRSLVLAGGIATAAFTSKATDAMVERYLAIRAMSDTRSGQATVPITPRQMEAFIRLAEASAKLRLATHVEPQDAQRAVDIVQEYLRSFGTSEHGTPDIDLLSTGRSNGLP